MTDLKPCPFCGGKAQFDRRGSGRVSSIVKCEDCGCTLESNESGVFNGDSWNDRHPDVSVIETENAALRERLEAWREYNAAYKGPAVSVSEMRVAIDKLKALGEWEKETRIRKLSHDELTLIEKLQKLKDENASLRERIRAWRECFDAEPATRKVTTQKERDEAGFRWSQAYEKLKSFGEYERERRI